MKKLILFCFTILFWYCTDAQVKHHIKKGNRNKAESQFTLEKGDLQAEWEIGYEKVSSSITTIIYPNLLIRYGITDRLEVNTEQNLVATYDPAVKPRSKTSGIEPIALGLSYELVKESPKRPSVIISSQLAFPKLASKSFTATYYAPTILINVQQPIKTQNILGVSSGAYWDGFFQNPSFVYNASYTYNAVHHWIFTGEYFGFIGQTAPTSYANISMAYSIKRQIQFGITGGVGLTSASYKNYVALNGILGFNTARHKKPTS